MTNNNPNPQQFQPQPVPQQQPAQQPPFAQQPHFQQPQQPAPQQPMMQQPYRQPAEEKHMSALGITAFVLGVIALVLSWIPIVNNVAFAFAIAGIIFGCFALYASRNIADSLKTVLFIGFLYACVMIYHSGYHLYTVSNI